MADTQILSREISGTPLVYTVPEAAEFTLKAIYVEYSDNGAASDWVPCVTIESDAHHRIAQAIDEGIIVGAGDDAEVSWFPYVKRSSGAGLSALPFLILKGVQTNVPSVPVGDSSFGQFDDLPVWTNDLNEWTFTLTAGGDIKQIDVAGPGLYYVACQFTFVASGATVQKACAVNTSSNVAETFNDPNFFGTSPFWQTDSLVFEAAMVEAWCPIGASGGRFTVEPTTNSAAGINFKPSYLFIVKFPLIT